MDDLLDTGKTLATTVELLKGEGADKVYGFATHARWVEGLVGWSTHYISLNRHLCSRNSLLDPNPISPPDARTP